MQKPAYLEFVELDDYCAHLAAHDRNDTRLEISVSAGRPRGKFQMASITVYAVATCRIVEGETSHIACWANVIRQTNNINAQMERDMPAERQSGRIEMFKNFEYVRGELEKRGLKVERGKWSGTSPDFLK